MARTTPLLSNIPSPSRPNNMDDRNNDTSKRTWFKCLPAFLIVILTLAPHPSLLIVLVHHYLETLQSPVKFIVHLLVTYTLTFCAFCSFIICIARDPGPITVEEAHQDDDDALDITQALMSADSPGDEDISSPGKFCRKCWAPKPERAHHCGSCGLCVLKMDHHCVWMASKCIGHRTYPAFLHFLCSITLLAIYIAAVSSSAIYYAFVNPMAIDETTPIHELFLTLAGIIFSIVIGSFLAYHLYLVSTNQTTIENLSPFLLLRHIPPHPSSTGDLVHYDEDRMSHSQRRLVRDAHGQIRLYDVGLRRNFAEVFGWSSKWGWIIRLICGGGSMGDGRTFLRNPRSDEMLSRLASELAGVDKDL